MNDQELKEYAAGFMLRGRPFPDPVSFGQRNDVWHGTEIVVTIEVKNA